MEKQDVSQVAKKVRALMREKKYREVVKIAKNLNLNRINNGLLILDIVEAYEKLGDKKAARTALLNYYDVHGITGRNMMQKLIELCIETRDISNAVGLCMEFENEWPESSISYLMRYQITTSAGGSLEERIYYLEKYKETEFEERWGYELAKLYDKNNQKEKCAEVCHEIICFFGTGKYVEKAVQLKERTTGLTEDEINIIEAAKHREEEERERREEEEKLAREEIARLAEEEARRVREQEEQRLREEERGQDMTEGQTSEPVQYAEWTYEETEEEYAARRARQAEEEKIRQTEEAARLLKEKKEAERIAREQKIAEALKTADRYSRIEKNRSEEIYFDDIIRNQGTGEEKQKQKKKSSEGNGIFSSFGRMASNVKKTLQPDDEYLEEDDTGTEIEYITVGRESRAYAEDIEERMLGELDMLDDAQIDELTSIQIKEMYELKVLRDVRENIKNLIIDIDNMYHVETSQEELEKFVSSDPFDDLLNRQIRNEADKKELKPEAESEPNEQVEKSEEESEKESEKSSEPEEKPEQVLNFDEKAGKISEEPVDMPKSDEESEEKNTESEKNTEAAVEKEKENDKVNNDLEELSEEDEESEMETVSETVPENDETVETEKEETGREKTENRETKTEMESEKEKVMEPVKETILDRIKDPDENLSVKEFTECITAYAEIKGYRVEDTAYMTIAVLAEEMQQKNTPLSLNNAKIMADGAITRIQKRNPLDKIMDHYSKKHAYLLKDKHFYWKDAKMV